jgi:hypothetical protein
MGARNVLAVCRLVEDKFGMFTLEGKRRKLKWGGAVESRWLVARVTN